jgi:hypothetical protein
LIRRERADPIFSVSGQIGKIKGVERGDLFLISLTFLLALSSHSKEGLGIAMSRGSTGISESETGSVARSNDHYWLSRSRDEGKRRRVAFALRFIVSHTSRQCASCFVSHPQSTRSDWLATIVPTVHHLFSPHAVSPNIPIIGTSPSTCNPHPTFNSTPTLGPTPNPLQPIQPITSIPHPSQRTPKHLADQPEKPGRLQVHVIPQRPVQLGQAGEFLGEDLGLVEVLRLRFRCGRYCRYYC